MGAGASANAEVERQASIYSSAPPPGRIDPDQRKAMQGAEDDELRRQQLAYAAAKAEGLTLQPGTGASRFKGVRPAPSFEAKLPFEAFYSPKPFVHVHLGRFHTEEEAALAFARATRSHQTGEPSSSSSPASPARGGTSNGGSKDSQQQQQQQREDEATNDLLRIIAKERSSPSQMAFQETVGGKYKVW